MTASRSLTLLTWPDYIDPASLRQFEAEFSIQVQIEVVPNAVELVQRVLMDEGAVDVLVPPDYAVRELVAAGRLYELEKHHLPNLRHLESRFVLRRPHDPDDRFSVIKDWGTTGYMYRTDVVQSEPHSWAEFWQLASDSSGRVTLLDAPAEVIGAALKMRGRSYNASGADDLAEARMDLLRLKPHLLAFETNYRPLVSSGEACLALGWSGDASALKAEGIPVEFVVPLEGSQIWEDDWAIAAGTGDPEAAHAFIDFMLRPAIAAREALYTRYATGNQTARAMLPDEVQHDPAIYPPDEVLDRLEPGLPLDGDAAERRSALWREIRE